MKHPRIFKITDEASTEKMIQQASELLRHGGVVVCATDTGYLLGVDGLNTKAIEKVYLIKGRSFNKPIHLVVSDIKMAKKLAYMDHHAERIFEQFFPGPLTVILKKKPVVPNLLAGGLESVGLRIPRNEFLLRLVKAADTPVTATSANRSGHATPYTVEQVLTELDAAAEFVDLLIDQGATQHASPSTILDMTRTPPRILREGPITANMLRDYRKENEPV